MSNGQIIGDGSWNLRVYVTDLQTERILRVKGDLHIGGVMLKLVEELGMRRFIIIIFSFRFSCRYNMLLLHLLQFLAVINCFSDVD